MKGTLFTAAALLLVTGLAQDSIVASRPLGDARTMAQRTDQGPGTKDQGPSPQAIVDRYCVTCHNGRTRAGGLALDALTVTDAHGEAQTWEKVVRKVRTGMMPPSGAPRPDRTTHRQTELRLFAGGADRRLDDVL